MSANLNEVRLIGHLTKDPELQTGNGASYCQFSIGINRRYTINGEQKEETTFVDCTAFNGQAKSLCEYMRKGSSVLVIGKLEQSRWETEAGEKRSRLKVIALNVQFLGAPKSAEVPA